MRFVLVYNGPLDPTGNKSRTKEIGRLRQALHPQLEFLWQTHNALQVLNESGALQLVPGLQTVVINDAKGARHLTPREMAAKWPNRFQDLCGNLKVGPQEYRPLVRESLSLCCELDILFLRQADPGALVSRGGDLDNRIKTLLDALRMPSEEEQAQAPPHDGPLYCLMESDHLVSALDVRTDRLLFPKSEKPNEVHLVIEVSLTILRVGAHNMCLL